MEVFETGWDRHLQFRYSRSVAVGYLCIVYQQVAFFLIFTLHADTGLGTGPV